MPLAILVEVYAKDVATQHVGIANEPIVIDTNYRRRVGISVMDQNLDILPIVVDVVFARIRDTYTAALRMLMTNADLIRTIYALPQKIMRKECPFVVTERHAENLKVVRASFRGALRSWRGRRNVDAGKSTYASWQRTADDGIASLVCADGSAMTLSTATNQHAANAFRRSWRFPWWIPDTYVVSLTLDDFLDCSSYHLEASCPTGVYLESTHLRVLNKARGTNEMILVRDDDLHADRAHLHFSRRLSRVNAPDGAYDKGSVRLILRPTYHNGLRTGMLLSLVSVAVLWLLFAVVGWPTAGNDCVVCSIGFGKFDTNSLVSLLILVPSVALAVLARSDEHDLTKKVHSRFRQRLALLSLVLFSVATLLTLQPRDDAPFWILLLAASAATLLAIPTVVSAIFSRREIKRITRGP